MRRHLWPLGLAAALLSPVSLWAQTSPTSPTSPTSLSSLTLEQALDQAASRHPAIAAALKEVAATEGALQQAGLWRNPELGATLEDTRPATRTTTVTVGIPLELGGKRAARISAADRARDVAIAGLGNARAELSARVVAAFFDALVAQERVKLAASSSEIATRAAEAVGKRVAAGKASPIDATRARVDLANAQLEAAEATTALQTARQALAAQLGDNEPSFELATGDVSSAPSRPPLAQLVAQLDAVPSLIVGQSELARRRALVDVERSKATPDLTLSLGAKRANDVGRTQAVIGFSVPLPLFDRNQGAVAEAARRADKAADELQATRLALLAELQEASKRMKVASTSLSTLQSTVLPSAQQAFDAVSRGFEAGKFGFLEVIDAQRSLLQARSRYLNTLSAAHQAAATIDRIVGR